MDLIIYCASYNKLWLAIWPDIIKKIARQTNSLIYNSFRSSITIPFFELLNL